MSTAIKDKTRLPAGADWGRLVPEGPGPVRAEDFESWGEDEDNPRELIGGWVLPMAPIEGDAGRSTVRLSSLLFSIATARGWDLLPDSRHRFPRPADTVLYPDLALHCLPRAGFLPGTKTIGRVPDLIIEVLARRTFERDMGPHGAKFLAYQMSGVKEYYYTWPDGKDASGFVLKKGVFLPLRRDSRGFFPSAILGCGLRLVDAATR